MYARTATPPLLGLLILAAGACSGPDDGAEGAIPELIGGQAPVVPAGTELSFRVEDDVSLDSHRVGDPFSATLNRPVRVGGSVVLPEGTKSRWEVARVTPDDGRGTAVLAVRLISIRVGTTWQSVDATSTAAALDMDDASGRTADVRVGADALPVGEPAPTDTPADVPPVRPDLRAVVAVAATEGVPRFNRGSVITVRLDQPLTAS